MTSSTEIIEGVTQLEVVDFSNLGSSEHEDFGILDEQNVEVFKDGMGY